MIDIICIIIAILVKGIVTTIMIALEAPSEDADILLFILQVVLIVDA